MRLLVIAQEEELPNYCQSSLSRVNCLKWPGVKGWSVYRLSETGVGALSMWPWGGSWLQEERPYCFYPLSLLVSIRKPSNLLVFPLNLGRIMAQVLVGTLEEGTDAASHLWEGILPAVPLKTLKISGLSSLALFLGQPELGNTFCHMLLIPQKSALSDAYSHTAR